ncbi:hypothetical protein BDQ17DRAFT_1254268 [Cyathus striatus]|nr:hypothetical protein BDQ17DRAFT_1254268 [Cyathus striatus]
MVGKTWVKQKEQLPWLREKFQEYLIADIDQQLWKTFYIEVNKEFAKKWGYLAPTAEEIDVKGLEKATVEARIKQEMHVEVWFRNVKHSSLNKGLPIISMKKQRIPSAAEAYHSLTYKEQWKTAIKVEYKIYTKNWEKKNPGVLVDKKFLIFMREFMTARYNEEGDEMKKKVEEHLESLHSVVVENETYQM